MANTNINSHCNSCLKKTAVFPHFSDHPEFLFVKRAGSENNWSSSFVVPPRGYLKPSHVSSLSPNTRLMQNVSFSSFDTFTVVPFPWNIFNMKTWIKKQMKNQISPCHKTLFPLSWLHQFTFCFPQTTVCHFPIYGFCPSPLGEKRRRDLTRDSYRNW